MNSNLICNQSYFDIEEWDRFSQSRDQNDLLESNNWFEKNLNFDLNCSSQSSFNSFLLEQKESQKQLFQSEIDNSAAYDYQKPMVFFEELKFSIPGHSQQLDELIVTDEKKNIPVQQKIKQPLLTFNNMPGFLISILRQLANINEFQQPKRFQQNQDEEFRKCFEYLIDVLHTLSSKLGKRSQLKMIFNQVGKDQSEKLFNKPKITKAQNKYLNMRSKFDEKILNKTKQALRSCIIQRATSEWIFNSAQTRKFVEKNLQKKELFERYVCHFIKELKQKNIKGLTNRKKVNRMILFQNRGDQSTKQIPKTSFDM